MDARAASDGQRQNIMYATTTIAQKGSHVKLLRADVSGQGLAQLFVFVIEIKHEVSIVRILYQSDDSRVPRFATMASARLICTLIFFGGLMLHSMLPFLLTDTKYL